MIAYDALFIALADAADTLVVTADGKLLKALEGTRYTRLVHPLADAYSLSPARAENPGVYCNRADTGQYVADELPTGISKNTCKMKEILDALGRARICRLAFARRRSGI